MVALNLTPSDMATSKIKGNGGEYKKLASFSATTSYASYTSSEDVRNFRFVYVATYGSGAPSSTTQSWGGTLIPVSMLLDKVFGSFVISYRSDYWIEFGLGNDTMHFSAKASDQYTRGITVYGIR